LSSIDYYFWYPDSSAWLYYLEDKFSWNDLGKLTNLTTIYHLPDTSFTYEQHIFDYDELGNMIYHYYATWNDTLFYCAPVYKEFWTYNQNSNMSTYKLQQWNLMLNKWDNILQEFYNYDSTGSQLVEYYSQYYNVDSNKWKNYQREVYEYYANGLLKSLISMYWYEDQYYVDWMNNERQDFSYDDDMYLTKILYSYWDYGVDLWHPYMQFSNFWHFLRAGLEQFRSFDFVVYPNPVSNKLYIKGIEVANYEIISTNGSIVKHGRFDNNTIDVNSLKPGFYVLKLTDRTGKLFTKKFVKY